MCFAQVMDSPTASVLIFVYLVVGVVILMNMLIAMMAKTFDSVFENSERNYMVMRVKFFVAYDDSDWPAPLNGLGMPYAIFKSSFDVTADKTCAAYTWCLPLTARRACVVVPARCCQDPWLTAHCLLAARCPLLAAQCLPPTADCRFRIRWRKCAGP